MPISVKEKCNLLQPTRTETEVKIFVYVSLLNLCLRYFRILRHPVLLCGHVTKMNIKIQGKAIAVQVWKGPEGSQRLRLPDFKTIGT